MIFLRCYQNSKWPPKVNSKFFCVRKNYKTLKSEIIQILLSHSPRYADVLVMFKVLLKFKMAATDQLHFFVGAKTQKISSLNLF